MWLFINFKFNMFYSYCVDEAVDQPSRHLQLWKVHNVYTTHRLLVFGPDSLRCYFPSGYKCRCCFPSRSSLPKECMALQKSTQRRTRTCSDTEAHSDRGAEETERESRTHHCTDTQIGFKALVQILLLGQALNLEWIFIVVALKMINSNI